MNTHYAFWVDYYEGLKTNEGLLPNNEGLIKTVWQIGAKEIINPENTKTLLLKVNYPGLLLGLGYAHDSGKGVEKEDSRGGKKEEVAPEIDLGFSLDYVTGLPYVPGSTVKGILRTPFIQNPDYIIETLSSEGIEITPDELKRIELEIFGRQHIYSDEDYSQLGDYETGSDCFLDAFPVQPTGKGELLGLENITPHRAESYEMDGLTTPTILNLLKVLPGVVFQFRFIISDSKICTELTSDKKQALYRQILQDYGVGAKTNVGFGVMTHFEDSELSEHCSYLEHNVDKSKRSQSAVGGGSGKQDLGPHAGNVLATVTGYNPQKTVAHLQTEANRKASLFFKYVPGAEYGAIDKVLKKGMQVNITYVGKDEKGYDQWKLVQLHPRVTKYS